VDAVVAVFHLSSELQAKVLDAVSGIDVVLGDVAGAAATRRQTRVELEGWGEEEQSRPALIAEARPRSFGEISLRFRTTDGKKELAGVEEAGDVLGSDQPDDPEMAAVTERVLGHLLAPSQALLPDPRGLWPRVRETKFRYSAGEIWNLAAQIARRKAHAEAALLRILPLGSNVPGEPQETFIREWMRSDDRIVAFTLPGSALRSL
jgi:hypothetical protein